MINNMRVLLVNTLDHYNDSGKKSISMKKPTRIVITGLTDKTVRTLDAIAARVPPVGKDNQPVAYLMNGIAGTPPLAPGGFLGDEVAATSIGHILSGLRNESGSYSDLRQAIADAGITEEARTAAADDIERCWRQMRPDIVVLARSVAAPPVIARSPA